MHGWYDTSFAQTVLRSFNPIKTAVPFWRQIIQISSSLSPQGDCSLLPSKGELCRFQMGRARSDCSCTLRLDDMYNSSSSINVLITLTEWSHCFLSLGGLVLLLFFVFFLFFFVRSPSDLLSPLRNIVERLRFPCPRCHSFPPPAGRPCLRVLWYGVIS